jgi:hypothetical protein
MEIDGLPLHPLVIHAVVVLVPLAALVAGAFAVVPRWRWLLRWPAVGLGVLGGLLVQMAAVSGEDLERSRGLGGPVLARHEMWADRLRIAIFALAVLTVLAAWLLPRAVPVVEGDDREDRLASQWGAAALAVPLSVLLVVASVAVLVLVFLTGEAGARAVWGTG